MQSIERSVTPNQEIKNGLLTEKNVLENTYNDLQNDHDYLEDEQDKNLLQNNKQKAGSVAENYKSDGEVNTV